MKVIARKNLNEAYERMLSTGSSTRSQSAEEIEKGKAIMQKLAELRERSRISKAKADAILARADWRKEE